METISVTELNRRARQALERALPLLWITGEISNLVRAASGHVYFTLKDEQAQVRCVMFRNRANLVPWQIANGQQIDVQALASIYEARGDFQLNIESMRRGGLGRLFESFARLKEKLDAEGLFSAERKRPLPPFPQALGIVTSLQAAALRDVLAACRRRAPHLSLIIFPTQVQGEGSTEQIVQAINAAGASGRCDALIVARGGGSIEDLWSFNDESVARAIASCSIPVVSGIGHETDFTIADFVADHRAATPTAAAELATGGWFSANAELQLLRNDLQQRMRLHLDSAMQRVDQLAGQLVHPRQRLENVGMKANHLRMQLDAAMRSALNRPSSRVAKLQLRLQRQRPNLALTRSLLLATARRFTWATSDSISRQYHQLDNLADALKLLDPNATLARGYSIARDAHGLVIRSSDALNRGDSVNLYFAKGWANTKVVDKD